jgi:hypothetical protein
MWLRFVICAPFCLAVVNPILGQGPFVVISRDEEIIKGDRIIAVGITGELNQSPADHYVLLPFGPNAKTGLKQKVPHFVLG